VAQQEGKGKEAPPKKTTNRMAQADQIFTIKELSEHLRVHPTTIYRLLRQGRLPGFRVGSNWRFSRDAIEQWERDQAGRAAGIPPRRRARRSRRRR
jgi:excisionase family DNA binding protein